jgi:hypothetical protein
LIYSNKHLFDIITSPTGTYQNHILLTLLPKNKTLNKMTAAITHPESNGSAAHVLPEGKSSRLSIRSRKSLEAAPER